MLQLLGVEGWPALLNPQLTEWMGPQLKFVGWERCERAWVMQEWDFEILSVTP